ncbi:hypothetical protein ACWX0P_10460 [Vibrio mediterranei]
MNVILNKDESRHRDWMAWDHPLITDSSDGDGACLIPYNCYTAYMYICGTYFCVKNEFYSNNSLDINLFWGEAEDIEWSMRVREKTKFEMNPLSTVKLMKLKDLDGAPYIKQWRDNEKKMLSFFESTNPK